jgi:protein ImuA
MNSLLRQPAAPAQPPKADATARDLAALRQRIRRLEGGGAAGGVLPFGEVSLDAALPGGGLALGALHEVMGAGPDEEDGAVAAAFAAGIAARLVRHRGAPILWCLGGDDLYGPGLAAHGLPLDRLLTLRCRSDVDCLWALEEGVRSGALAGIVGELAILPPAAGRRLQLAAEASGITMLLLRRWREGRVAARQRLAPSVAVTRWRVGALPCAASGESGIGTPLWQVELLRCRGGTPAHWILEASDATGHVAVAAALADRSAAPNVAAAGGDRRRAL